MEEISTAQKPSKVNKIHDPSNAPKYKELEPVGTEHRYLPTPGLVHPRILLFSTG